MSSSNDSKIEILRLKLSKMVLNDSRAIFRRKQMKKVNNQHWIEHSALRQNRRVRRRIFNESNKKSQSTVPMPKKSKEWKSEYDLLNMITYSVNKDLVSGPRWNGNDIGIRTSQNQIQLIENLTEFNQQFLIDPNGNTVQAKDIIQPNDLLTENSLRIKYKLVPVIESFTLVKNGCSVETEYKISTETADCNNNNKNNNDDYYNHNHNNPLDDLDDIDTNGAESDTNDITITPIEENQFESYEPLVSSNGSIAYVPLDVPDYSVFLSSIQTSASSTFVFDKSRNLVSTPPKRKIDKSGVKVYVDSPRPDSTEESSWPDCSIQSDLELTEMIVEYERIKALHRQMGSHLKRVETKIKQLLQESLDNSSILSCYRDKNLLSIIETGSISDFTL